MDLFVKLSLGSISKILFFFPLWIHFSLSIFPVSLPFITMCWIIHGPQQNTGQFCRRMSCEGALRLNYAVRAVADCWLISDSFLRKGINLLRCIKLFTPTFPLCSLKRWLLYDYWKTELWKQGCSVSKADTCPSCPPDSSKAILLDIPCSAYPTAQVGSLVNLNASSYCFKVEGLKFCTCHSWGAYSRTLVCVQDLSCLRHLTGPYHKLL